ncbi:uncharacterized protein LOC143432383 [Xylocopa sonorina]|uniref:uncharacterized protein LOC143432383 n=1 Tax=Xylocopa sonorina TaxID=1818115 RepID=UPI00403AE820
MAMYVLHVLNHSRYVHIILTTCFPANPKDLWEKYKNYMSEDILHRMRRLNANPNIQCTSNIYNEVLILIEDVCLTIANKSLTELGMITLNRSGNDIFDQQRTAYDTIINAISNKSCGLYFLDAPDGTATLLDGDRTAHSALKMPLNMQVTETPTCNISKYSGMGKVLRSRQLDNMG